MVLLSNDKPSSPSSIEAAKSVAKNIWNMYYSGRSNTLQGLQVSQMLCDAYGSINRIIQPTQLDLDSYSRVLDRNGDGFVTYEDIEKLCIKYLLHDNLTFSPLYRDDSSSAQ